LSDIKVQSDAYKLFILAETVNDQHVQAVSEFCKQQGLEIIQTADYVSSQCVCLALSIEFNDIEAVRSVLKEQAARLDLDLVLLEEQELQRSRKLAVFDMDSTLIEVEVIDELAKKAGVGEQVMSITAAAMRGELDFNQSFEQRLGLLEGLSESVLAQIAEALPIMAGMENLISQLHKKGYKTAILSGGFNYFAHYLQSKYHFDYAYSNTLEIVDNKVTGKVVGEIVNGERKVSYLKEIAEKEGINLSDTIAVGDGANDLPMLATANLGVAFHAKPLVVERAEHAISHLGLDALLYLIK
jgi:phosphoserine phosphatase